MEPASGEDEVAEAAAEPRTSPPASSAPPEPSTDREQQRQQSFLGRLGLITSARLLELQSKRAERKRRSTAGSHFVYSNWEVPMVSLGLGLSFSESMLLFSLNWPTELCLRLFDR